MPTYHLIPRGLGLSAYVQQDIENIFPQINELEINLFVNDYTTKRYTVLFTYFIPMSWPVYNSCTVK